MFGSNKFLKKDPLVEAVQKAQQDGEIRRQAVAHVNEQFGVYSRNAVIRENLAAYDAAVEEAYKCMKEEGKLAKKDYDKDGKVESPKDEVWGSRLRAAKMAGKMEEAKGTAAVQNLKHRDFKEIRHPNPGAVTKAPVPGVSIAEDQLDEISNEVKKSYLAKTRPLSDAPKTTYGNRTSGTIDSHINRAGDRAADSGKSAAVARNKKRDIVAHTRKLVKSQLKSQLPEGWEGSKEDKAEDKALAKKHGMTMKQWEKSAADKKHDAKERMDEAVSRKHFQQVADLIKGHESQEKRNELASHHAGIFAKQNPRFNHEKFHAAAGSTAHQAPKKMEEAVYSAKAARAGKDIGKTGKQFKNIAKKAGAKYGSLQRGEKVAGAILAKIRAKHMKEENLHELSAFGAEFAKQRAAGAKTFSFGGKSYNTKMASSKPASSGPQNNPGLKGATGFQRTMKTDVGNIKVSPSTPGSGYSQSAERMKAMKAPETPGSMKISAQPAPTSGPSGQEKMDTMKNLKPDAPSPTTPGSMKISAQPAPSTGPSGAEKMDTMNSLSKPTAPTPSPAPSPAPSMSMSDPKAKALKESVQVGDYKYRIV